MQNGHLSPRTSWSVCASHIANPWIGSPVSPSTAGGNLQHSSRLWTEEQDRSQG